MMFEDSYTVNATPWGEQGWELEIEGVGVTQARTEAEVPEMVWEYLSLTVGEEADGAMLDIYYTDRESK